MDIIDNTILGNSYPYEYLQEIGKLLGLHVKELLYNISSEEALEEAISLTYNRKDIEGIVLEDAKQKRLKVKSNFYTYWKKVRGLIPKVVKHIPISYSTPQEAYMVTILKSMPEELLPFMSIPEIRKAYYEKCRESSGNN